MKLTRKVLALVLCLVMVMGLAVSAGAATVINETGHSYDVYQVFSGTQSAGSVNLGDVAWGSGVDGDALLAELQSVYDIYDSCTTAAGVASILASDSPSMDKDTDAKNFANIAAKHLTTKTTTIAATDTSVELPTGYYLLVDITELVPDEDGVIQDANNPALLQVTNAADVKIAKKYTVPSSEKKIITDAKAEADADEKSIGDTVTFQLKGTLPNNLADYDTYKLVFHDKLSDGLTFNGTDTVTVTVCGTPVTTGFEVKTTDTCGTDCDLEVIFENIKSIPSTVSSGEIYITYTATLNEDAVINGTGNPNEMQLEFSNDPNWQATPDDGDDTNDTPPTGFTPWDEVVVYTTEVQITKKDGTTKEILTGAAFELTGEGENIVIVTGEMYVAYAADEKYVDGNKYWLLNDDTYTATDPATEGIDISKYVNTDIVYKKINNASVDTQDGTNKKVEAFVGEDGILKFSGLGVGEYTITETVTPAGYNTIQPITLKITYEDGAFVYAWSGGANGAVASITVNNYKGSTLPETGGMGTTLFYVIGGLMVLGAAVLLVTKKRMTAE
ncbi:MAG: isopeptide-forming domain-containing fimbrial protein [Oscillospiraceae bacterium]|nr:isopeptide-forming domain-containing fimbrial protein [Oscillospiraceae bacterium]